MLLQRLQRIQTTMPELALTAVKQNGLALKYVVNKTAELCRIAVAQNPEAIKFVPFSMRKEMG
jgi:hypothetical protein